MSMKIVLVHEVIRTCFMRLSVADESATLVQFSDFAEIIQYMLSVADESATLVQFSQFAEIIQDICIA